MQKLASLVWAIPTLSPNDASLTFFSRSIVSLKGKLGLEEDGVAG